MAPALSPPKVVLLAAHLAATGDVAGLAAVAARHGEVLRKPLLLRLLLTYLPAHLPTATYVPLLKCIEAGDFGGFAPLVDPDPAPVATLTDAQATKKVKKLQLQHLGLPRDGHAHGPAGLGAGEGTRHLDEDTSDNDNDDDDDDDLVAFLIQRACAVDTGAGALPDLPALVVPFLDRSKRLRSWAVSTLLPLLRRNCEYYPDSPIPQTLADFEHLPDRLAVDQLLSQTGQQEDSRGGSGGESSLTVVRDLRGLVGPWLYSERRWPSRQRQTSGGSSTEPPPSPSAIQTLCPGWEEVLHWLTTQAAQPATWPAAIRAVEQWDGPTDVDLGGLGTVWLNDGEQAYLEKRYARAALACVYLVPDASQEALEAAHRVVVKIAGLLEHDSIPPFKQAVTQLRPVPTLTGLSQSGSPGNTSNASNASLLQLSPQNAAYFLRHDLLDEANPLTAPVPAAIELLHALLTSASVLGHRGNPHTVRQVADLALLQNEREQKTLATKLLRWVTDNGPQSDYHFWTNTRSTLQWLRDWGAEEAAKETGAALPQKGSTIQPAAGVLGRVSKVFLETEFLKALLTKSCFSYARTFFEAGSEHSLSAQQIQDAVFAAAMNAYDNASNPNRTRGGLKKCDEIIRALPEAVKPTLPVVRQTEALLAATHSLSDYRLVLKQGEPFTPVVLRVHPDPLSILGKVLEQNPRSYTKLQDLLGVAANLVEAGLVKSGNKASAAGDDLEQQRVLAERRVTAMCIEAALNEDDFETAYSYVVGRLAETEAAATTAAAAASSVLSSPRPPPDSWSWRAALAAGKYRRTERTVRPTHLGIAASANLDIRHLEQRVACLATALRIAPADTLHEILVAYRRCEEELEAAVRAEDEQETAWDDKADWTSWQQEQQEQEEKQQQWTQTRKKPPPPQNMPGGFGAELGGGTRSSSGGVPLASRMAAATHRNAFAPTPAPAPGSAAADDTPLSLFDLSRATARAAQRNLTALANLRQTRQLVGLSDDGDAGAAADADSSASSAIHVRKRDQLREAAMGTLTSGVGWLIGAQPVNRTGSGSNHWAGE